MVGFYWYYYKFAILKPQYCYILLLLTKSEAGMQAEYLKTKNVF